MRGRHGKLGLRCDQLDPSQAIDWRRDALALHEREAKLAAAMAPVNAKLKAWDFSSASEPLAKAGLSADLFAQWCRRGD